MTGPDAPEFDAVVMRSGDSAIVRIAGALDLSTADLLRAALNDALSVERSRITVDLAGVTFVDPAGSRPLLEAVRNAQPRTRLSIRHSTPLVRRVLVLMGLTDFLDP